jgi:molecular chaperone IbpA
LKSRKTPTTSTSPRADTGRGTTATTGSAPFDGRGRIPCRFKEGIMRHYDLTPFYRSTIGFDRLFQLLDEAAGAESAPTYPPYNIERTDENAYRITVAVAGFAEAELSLEVKENLLTVRGEKHADADKPKGALIHQGIAARAFERRFQLADHVNVTGASLQNGLLHIDLLREIPEAKKPRLIPIGAADASANGSSKAKLIEASAKPGESKPVNTNRELAKTGARTAA